MILEINIVALGKSLVMALVTTLLSFFMPVGDFIMVMFILVVADLFTGRRAARHRGELMYKGGGRRTIEKIALYFVAIAIVHLVESVYVRDAFQGLLVWTTSAVIAWHELKSNIINISEVTGTDIWSRLAEKIPSFVDLIKKKDDGKPK